LNQVGINRGGDAYGALFEGSRTVSTSSIVYPTLGPTEIDTLVSVSRNDGRGDTRPPFVYIVHAFRNATVFVVGDIMQMVNRSPGVVKESGG
jgi:hypothetical protein